MTFELENNKQKMLNKKNHSKRARACLFAGYNPDGKVYPYIIDYLEELARHCDIFYMADGEIDTDGERALKKYCTKVWSVKHGKYDFGSYSELANIYVGWDALYQYDEVIFANDSCFCVQPFDAVFAKMDREACDVWALLATDENNKDYLYTLDEYLAIPSKKLPLFCLGSYFLVFRGDVIRDIDFQEFINSVQKEAGRYDVCVKYEMGLTSFLKKKGFKLSAYIKIVYRNVTIYDEQAFRLLKKGFPLIKTRIFRDNPLSIPNLADWSLIISRYVNNNKIFAYLDQIGFVWKQELLTFHVTPKLSFSARWLPPIFRMGIRNALKLMIPPQLLSYYRQLRDIRRKKKVPHQFLPLVLSAEINIDKKRVTNNRLFSQEPPVKRKQYDSLVIFFNVANDTIGGGMLSINRFVAKSIEIAPEFGFDVIVSGLPLENPVVSYSKFSAASPMVDFADISARFQIDKLILHIPELYVPMFIDGLTTKQRRWLKTIGYLQINILDQNHDFFPDRYYIECCRELTDDVTITTAHVRYTSQDMASKYDCPVTLLTPFLPEFYRVPYQDKEKIIAISPDDGPMDQEITKEQILQMLASEFPEYKIEIINNLSLEEYKRLISSARFTITFGEGYDGYFIEPFLSDSLAFAVYNETFFPKDFAHSPTVYDSWSALFANIVADIRKLEQDSKLYRKIGIATEKIIRQYTNNDISMKNLKSFYRREFDYLPEIYQNDALFEKGSDQISGLEICNGKLLTGK